jgi:hypothetical protein
MIIHNPTTAASQASGESKKRKKFCNCFTKYCQLNDYYLYYSWWYIYYICCIYYIYCTYYIYYAYYNYYVYNIYYIYRLNCSYCFQYLIPHLNCTHIIIRFYISRIPAMHCEHARLKACECHHGDWLICQDARVIACMYVLIYCAAPRFSIFFALKRGNLR